MDINMPVMNGIDAARAIRESEKAAGTPRTPIVAVTAAEDTILLREKFRDAGIDCMLQKPVSKAKFMEAALRFGLRTAA